MCKLTYTYLFLELEGPFNNFLQNCVAYTNRSMNLKSLFLLPVSAQAFKANRTAM